MILHIENVIPVTIYVLLYRLCDTHTHIHGLHMGRHGGTVVSAVP